MTNTKAAIIISVLLICLIITISSSIRSGLNHNNCNKACGIYKSYVIEDSCYCKTMPQTLIEYQTIKKVE